ncbi:alpha-N-acetylgalactosaminide alpha-2,6-sialyltransferase 2 [Myxocyprinus asiaticus]|uniref:alpha-N-acetylgalactosaminide alpha-2,6-sialyltransferase 2 n=1 Tax=Myxocyprinus asiaticus TaxID=70543 RepID=UPI002222646C|nr:alpha-N-acetylgalactosaminide alpha-2,6-sialyltransferase 2 [Myxocyprinus asiaticus]
MSARNMKSWICKLPLLALCVLFIYWKFLEFMSAEDWRSIYQRAFLEDEDSWIGNNIAEEEAVPACSMRHTIKKDDSLRKDFNFLVPVLQWRDTFTQSEWQKLHNLASPYGWKEQSYDEIGKTLSLLWHPSNSRLFTRNMTDECVRCAVVGNGGILKGSGQGKAINSHHYVFRVNGAIIKGFEDDVGTKTSFYGFTINSLKNSLAAYYEDGFNMVPRNPDIQYIFIPAGTRDYVMLAAAIQGVPVLSGFDKGDRPSQYFGDYPQVNQFKMLHPRFIKYVTERFLKSPLLEEYPDLYMPSTGALMLLTALHTCDQVSAYGFITENYNEFSDHYFDKEKKDLVFYANHDMQMEGLLWKLLHSRKVMWLYQRQNQNPSPKN